MAKLKPIVHSKDYAMASEQFIQQGDKSFCAPLAVALLTDTDVDRVAEIFARLGRKHGHGTYHDVTMGALGELGFVAHQLDIAAVVASYPKPHCTALKGMTTHHFRRFPEAFDPSKRYLAITRNHAVAVIDGEVKDWSVNNTLRIAWLYEIVRK